MEMQKILLHAYTLFTSEELVARMDENDVPSAIINKLEDVIDDPQVKNNDSIMKLSSNDNNSMQSPRSPAQYSSTPCSNNPKFMPDLGEHSREILLENGFSDEKIRTVKKMESLPYEAPKVEEMEVVEETQVSEENNSQQELF